MININLIEQIIVIAINFIGFWLALWIYMTNRKKRLNQWFAVMTFSVVAWVNFAFLGYQANDSSLATIFYRLNWASVALFLVSAFHFYVMHFLQEKGKYKILEKIILFTGVSLIFISILTGFIIEKTIIQEWGAEITFGLGNILFNLYSIVVALLVVGLLMKKYSKLARRQKLKVLYFLIGTFLFALSNVIFNIILPSFKKSVVYQRFGDYSAILLVSFTAYAILKQKLFNIKVILTQLLVGLITALLLINLISADSIFGYVWKGGLFLVFLIFGWFLVKSVVREIKQREQIDRYAGQLGVANVKLKKTYAKLQKLDKAKSEFISIASHQLRTPLTAVKGYISMIIEGDYGIMPKETEKPMRNVYASNERLIKLVNSLLNLSRLEAGKIKIEKAKFFVQDMLESIILEFSSQAKQRGIKLTFVKPKEKIPIVNADQQKLRQVVANLIDNALKYTEQGSVKVSLSKEGKNVKMLVADTGEGMTEEELGEVFESFSRAGAGKRMFIEGAGLGLYVAKKFINMQKGKIWAESLGKGKGHGSTFHIVLPIK